MPEGLELLNPREAAQVLRSTPGTLAVWRCTRRHPLKFTRVGRKIFYRPEDIREFIDAGIDPGNAPKVAKRKR